jgi:hypothetical protein
MMLMKKNTSPLHRDRHARPAVRFQPGQRPRHEPVPAAFVEDLIEKKEMSVPYGQSVGGMWLLGNTHLLPVSSPPQVVRVYVNLAAVPELFPLFGKVMKINRRLRWIKENVSHVYRDVWTTVTSFGKTLSGFGKYNTYLRRQH